MNSVHENVEPKDPSPRDSFVVFRHCIVVSVTADRVVQLSPPAGEPHLYYYYYYYYRYCSGRPVRQGASLTAPA